MFVSTVSVTLLLLSPVVLSAPTGTPTQASASPSPTVPYASDDPNVPEWGPDSDVTPEPIRNKLGATSIVKQNIPIELQNPALLAPPTTDHGTMCV